MGEKIKAAICLSLLAAVSAALAAATAHLTASLLVFI